MARYFKGGGPQAKASSPAERETAKYKHGRATKRFLGAPVAFAPDTVEFKGGRKMIVPDDQRGRYRRGEQNSKIENASGAGFLDKTKSIGFAKGDKQKVVQSILRAGGRDIK